MRPERTEADGRALRAVLLDNARRNLAHYQAEGSEEMVAALRHRIDALEAREPYIVTGFTLPRRFWPDGADLWSAYVLEVDDTLRAASVEDPEAAA